MPRLTSLSTELLVMIARLLGPADAACLYMVNKEFHQLLRCHLDFARHLVESPDTSPEVDLLEVRRERRSLMERLRADYSEEDFGLCEFCLTYKRYDDDWAQKRISAGSSKERIIDVCSACKNLPEYENTRWYTPTSEGLWPNESKARYLGGFRRG